MVDPLYVARAALACVAVFALGVPAQASPPEAQDAQEAHASRAALSAELFYEMLLAELTAVEGAWDEAQALMMEAARTSSSEQLYRRGVEMALQSRSAAQALANAQAWLAAWPASRNANRFVLQILLHVGRVADSAGHLARELTLVPAADKADFLAHIPQLYANASDSLQAADVVEQALAHTLGEPQHAAMAWVVLGHMRLHAGQKAQALAALRQAQAVPPSQVDAPEAAQAIVGLCLQLLQNGVAEVEADIQRHLARHPSLALGVDYASALMAQHRLTEARRQLIGLTAEFPAAYEVWSALASLQLQMGDVAQAHTSTERMGALLKGLPEDEHRNAQAQYTVLRAQVAGKQGRWRDADALLRSIEGGETSLFVQTQRAAALLRQGRVQQALERIRSVPARDAREQHRKQLAEVDILRDAGRLRQAYAVQARLHRRNPGDANLAYDLALLAERIGRLDEMERLLRGIIARHPDYQHAYNALGYSFAERNIRLQEAEHLIRHALTLAPGDPFITDSLGWVKYRLGDLDAARQLLETAWATRADVEIGAHLGEVLWRLGDKARARSVWQQSRGKEPHNKTLRETLRRLGVTL